MVAGLPNLSIQKSSQLSNQSSLQNLLFNPNINVIASSPSTTANPTTTASGSPSLSAPATLGANDTFTIPALDFLSSKAPTGLTSQLPTLLSSLGGLSVPNTVDSINPDNARTGEPIAQAAMTDNSKLYMLIGAGVIIFLLLARR